MPNNTFEYSVISSDDADGFQVEITGHVKMDEVCLLVTLDDHYCPSNKDSDELAKELTNLIKEYLIHKKLRPVRE